MRFKENVVRMRSREKGARHSARDKHEDKARDKLPL
jgi:hypothetical protein